jgi:signal transduction histidine kinase
MNEKAQRDRSRRMADQDLAHRTRLSGLVYLALFGIMLVFTPYSHDHTLSAAVVSTILLLGAGLRSWLALGFERYYPSAPDRWVAGFSLLTLLLAGTWGLFCAHTLLQYGLHWTAMLALLSTAGISAGAISTLSINRKLIMACLALLLLPPTVAAAFLQSRESLAVTLMFLTYCAFMFSMARTIHKTYWEALNNTLLLDLHARELEASNRELETYSYSIAHDLRTPLRSIIGFSQILREELDDRMAPSERDDMKRVIDAGKHMSKLIDDILELSRITRRDLDYRDIDLSAMIQAHADALAVLDPERRLDVRVQPGLHAMGDKRLLDLALQNLLENAWKFSSGRDRTEIVFSASGGNGETVYSLRDNGVGFDMAHAGNLFKPFERLHHHAEFPGTGVGLATVQRIIQRHGGRIWAESTPGKGACFNFTLK